MVGPALVLALWPSVPVVVVAPSVLLFLSLSVLLSLLLLWVVEGEVEAEAQVDRLEPSLLRASLQVPQVVGVLQQVSKSGNKTTTTTKEHNGKRMLILLRECNTLSSAHTSSRDKPETKGERPLKVCLAVGWHSMNVVEMTLLVRFAYNLSILSSTSLVCLCFCVSIRRTETCFS